MIYLPAAIIIALLLYVFGHICVCYGERRGFRLGCQNERRFNANRHIIAGRTKGFWQSQN